MQQDSPCAAADGAEFIDDRLPRCQDHLASPEADGGGPPVFARRPEIVHSRYAKVACDGHFGLRSVFPSLHAAKARRGRSGLAGTFATKENIMPIGTVKFFNQDKGYGFIQPEGSGNDAFVHISAVERAGMTTLNKDQRISYDLENDQRGKTSAVNLQSA
jgi:CspA family cold shock protein